MPATARDSIGLRASSGERDADGDNVPPRPAASEPSTPRPKASENRATFPPISQLETPSILRHFPARRAYFRILRARLIQHGIGIVQMHKNFPRALQSRQPS